MRSRIIAIAAIPVAGFLVNGTAFHVGETAVETALASDRAAVAMVEASGDLKSAVTSIQSAARSFVAQPRQEMAAQLDNGLKQAVAHFRRIEALDLSGRKQTEPVERILNRITFNVTELIKEVNTLGGDESGGIRKELADAPAAIENAVAAAKAGSNFTADAIATSLLVLTQREAGYRATGLYDLREKFRAELENFGNRGRRRADFTGRQGHDQGGGAGLCDGFQDLGRVDAEHQQPSGGGRFRYPDRHRRRQRHRRDGLAAARSRGHATGRRAVAHEDEHRRHRIVHGADRHRL
ncbi:MAG: hypothetical protein M5U33_12115 [Pseudorhodoplanes sp.]|nr:hypothetical protein [Pseudorhodoplanes sp.]